MTDWLPLSILNVTFLMRNVQTSSQNRYVSRLPWLCQLCAFLRYFARGYLELQPTLHILLQRLGDGLVEVAENLHGQLRIDAFIADEVIERIGQSEPDTAVVSKALPCNPLPFPYLLLRYSS